MIKYTHFALANLYLLNGYTKFETPYGDAYEYADEDGLEQAIRRLLLLSPKRLDGKALRFLRRGLQLSQEALAKLLDRDAQTIARWEKSPDLITAPIDLNIRVRFAAAFDPRVSMKDLIDASDGNAPPLPDVIYLTYVNGRWMFLLKPTFHIENIKMQGHFSAFVPASSEHAYKIFESKSIFENHGVQAPSQVPVLPAIARDWNEIKPARLLKDIHGSLGAEQNVTLQ